MSPKAELIVPIVPLRIFGAAAREIENAPRISALTRTQFAQPFHHSHIGARCLKHPGKHIHIALHSQRLSRPFLGVLRGYHERHLSQRLAAEGQLMKPVNVELSQSASRVSHKLL